MRIFVKNSYTFVILIASLLILGVGIVLKPRKKLVRQLSESDLARTQQIAQRARLNDLSRFLADAAENASERLLFLKSVPHTAVVWDRHQAVTARPASGDKRISMVLENGDKELQTTPLPSGVPLALLSVPAEVSSERPPVPPSLNPGDWAIAVARQDDEQLVFSHGIYQGQTEATCDGFTYRRIDTTAVISPLLEGGGLFTLQGGLLGLVVDCRGVPAVMSAASVTAALRQPLSIEDSLLQTWGVRVQSGTSTIAMVWSETPAGRAGLRPGDIISAPGLESVASGQTDSLTIRRGATTLRVPLSDTPAAAPEAEGMRFDLDPSTRLVRIASVAQSSPAHQAGIAPGDEIANIGASQVKTPQQAVRLLAARKKGPVFLTIQRGTLTALVAIRHE